MLICAPRYTSSVATTRKMPSSTSHAAPVCDPKNRDFRPSSFGLFRSLMIAKVPMPTSTPTANRSSRKPITGQCPIPGIANVRLNRSP